MEHFINPVSLFFYEYVCVSCVNLSSGNSQLDRGVKEGICGRDRENERERMRERKRLQKQMGHGRRRGGVEETVVRSFIPSLSRLQTPLRSHPQDDRVCGA